MFFQIETILWWFPSDFQILPLGASYAHGQRCQRRVGMGARSLLRAVSVKFFSRAWRKANKSYKKQAQSWSKLINGIKFCGTNFFCWSFFSFGSRIYNKLMLRSTKKSTNSKRSEYRSFSLHFSKPAFWRIFFDYFFSFSVDEIRSCVECSYKWNSKFA